MTSTPNYGWIMPTNGGDADTWGAECITLWGQQDTDLKTVANVGTANATATTALTTRVTTLEAATPVGLADWLSGQYLWGRTCEGLESELAVLTSNRRYLVPFTHLGTFDAFCFSALGPAATYTWEVLDSAASGAPSATVLRTGSYTVAVPGSEVKTFTSLTLTRPAWLTLTGVGGGQVYTRGTTGAAPSNFVLGTSTLSPTVVSDVTRMIYGAAAPYTAVTLGTKAWALGLALRTA